MKITALPFMAGSVLAGFLVEDFTATIAFGILCLVLILTKQMDIL